VGEDGSLSGWTVVALAILAGSGMGRGGHKGHYLGNVAVRKAMEAVAGMDDALLLGEDVQDPYVAEAAATIASEALPNGELSPEVYDNLARVLGAIDRKVRRMKTNRLR
jgi:hypothetical protein